MYTKLEVVQMLVFNMNTIMEMIDNKEFKIDYKTEEVYCERVRMFLPNSELSRHSFDYIIREANGTVKD